MKDTIHLHCGKCRMQHQGLKDTTPGNHKTQTLTMKKVNTSNNNTIVQYLLVIHW